VASVTNILPAGSLHEIGTGVHAWVQPDGTWWINNAGAICGDRGTVIVDTCATERRTRAFLRAVAAATGDTPVRLAVSTHQHGDHTYGNSLLSAATVIIAHEATRAGQLADPVIDGCPPFWSPVPDWGQVTRRAADVVLRSDLTIHAGERLIEVRHPGYAAHTAGDVVAWLPDERILFAGDLLFHGLTPLVFMGSVDGSIRSLDWIAAFDAELVVPGHGPIAGRAALPDVLAAHERYYRLTLSVAREGLRDGIGPLEAARRADLGEFAAWTDAERLVLNLHRAYADATGTQLDTVAAFTDTVSWHGGPLPTSV
jgi:cyclase